VPDLTIAQLAIPRGKALLINTNGERSLIDFPPNGHLGKAIGAAMCDTVILSWMPHGHIPDLVMVVDDDGWETTMVDHGDGRLEFVPTGPKRPVNDIATDLYREVAPAESYQIAGDVLILHDGDSPSH
jgi:hypothetical protein